MIVEYELAQPRSRLRRPCKIALAGFIVDQDRGREICSTFVPSPS